MVDVLMQLADDPSLEVKLQREHIKALIQTISVEWAMSELLKNPGAIQKATEELDRVIERDRGVEEKDIVNLPYIEAIVKRNDASHPMAPLLVP
ncbi:hypothetical protein WN944_022634 [Citrus x changshan-huyou]|uniref:Cytochrome P450 n=1 Tax=Citrus x changshan-huyou TaxID=2935761 RepID=A0AAP0N3P2_9ROSI